MSAATGASSDKSESVSKTLYCKHLRRAKASSSWFQFFRDYYKIMSRLDALFLQDLWNLSSAGEILTREIDNDLYFLCTENFLLNCHSRWTIDEQKRHIRSLAAKGFIKRAIKGIPGCRWVHIDIGAIETALDAAEGAEKAKNPNDSQLGGKPPNWLGGKPPNRLGGKPPTNKGITYPKNKEATSPASPDDAGGSKNPLAGMGLNKQRRLDVWDDLARLLYDGVYRRLQTNRGINLQTWAKQLRDGFAGKVDPETIRRHIKIHVENVGRTDYWPTLLCAKKFVERYDESLLPAIRNRQRRSGEITEYRGVDPNIC